MRHSLRILIHIGFWLLFMVLPRFFYALLRNPGDMNRMYMFMVDFGINIISFYLAYFFFIPYLIKAPKKWVWIIIVLSFTFLYGFLISNIILSIAESLEIRYFKKFTFIIHYFRETIGILLFIAYGGFIRLTENWIIDQRLKNELIQQNRTSELALLKSQVSPHFLFNTLNNIYSLVYQKADKAPSAVMKLSEIMRYMLYEASTEKVLLEKEIEYLKSYIELQSLRLQQKDFVRFSVTGDPTGKKIAPMLLIPFVENAFKHGNKKASPPGIIIKLDVSSEKIYFEVINLMVVNEQKSVEGVEGGIGLVNVKRRLKLIYPNAHELFVDAWDRKYTAKLSVFETNENQSE